MKTLIALSLLVLLPIHLQAAYQITDSKVLFVAKGFPSFIKITGETSELQGTLSEDKDLLSGTLVVNPATLKTGMDLRDEHMRDKYLEVKKFNQIALTLKPFKPQDSGKTAATLKLHGKEKEVMVNYDFKREGEQITVKAHFDIDIKDFDIDIPSFQGITVAKDVKLQATFKAKK